MCGRLRNEAFVPLQPLNIPQLTPEDSISGPLFSLVAFDVRRTQHIILGFLWYSVKIRVVLKGDLLWYSFRRTSAFSAPF